MAHVTYLIYILFWELLTLGGSAYLVFGRNEPWWLIVVGVVLGSMCFKPERWIHGKELGE